MQWIKQLAALVMLLGAGNLNASEELWQAVDAGARGQSVDARLYQADEATLRALLAQAPLEGSGAEAVVVQLPQVDGSIGRFKAVESPVVQAGLAADFPEFKSYLVHGIDDPSASGRVNTTPRGIRGMIIGARGRLFIDPARSPGGPAVYEARHTRSITATPSQCQVDELAQAGHRTDPLPRQSAARVPGMLLEYRIAVSATEEYVNAFDGTVPTAQMEIMDAIARVNVIYERDLGIRLRLIAGNQSLIETAGAGIFSNDSADLLVIENQIWIDSQIPTTSYDIGHVFSTGGGGLAFFGSVCDNANKARGASGQPMPQGDPFHIDFVAHEIGHQFRAEHTFNGTTLSCGGFFNRVAASAFEPGSGSTIMAYAGICGVEDLQNNSDATFHAGSISQIDTFANGLACGAMINTSPVSNADPTITVAQADQTIPIKTAFALGATATDADLPAQTLLYQWDQMDAGDATDAVSFGTDKGNNPLFRSYPPQMASRRDFPALGTQVRGNFDDAEVVPCNARALDFRLTVRDQASGQVVDDVRITTTTAAGPFRITNYTTPQTIVVNDNSAMLTWDTSNTDQPPVNCPTVEIDLLTFSDPFHSQYSVHNLMTGVSNDGSELINFPIALRPLDSPIARFRLSCSNNVFYDISDANLFIDGTGATGYSTTDFTTFFNNGGTVGTVEPACGSPGVTAVLQPGDSGDSGAVEYWWLLLLGGLAYARRCRQD